MGYYNTVPEEGEKLKDYENRALSQEKRILDFFQRKRLAWTPSEVLTRVFKVDTPLTSVRRAITDLTNEGKLKQAEPKRVGLYGRNENTWRIA